MSDNAWALQQALYTALDGVLSVPVYDSVPETATYPYVTIDYTDGSNADFLNSRKDSKVVYFSVWSTYRGQKEVLEIMSEMDTILHNKDLALSSGRVAQMRVESKRTNREPDMVTYMGQLRLLVLVEH